MDSDVLSHFKIKFIKSGMPSNYKKRCHILRSEDICNFHPSIIMKKCSFEIIFSYKWAKSPKQLKNHKKRGKLPNTKWFAGLASQKVLKN